MSGRVVVLPELVAGGGPAVADVAPAARERRDEASRVDARTDGSRGSSRHGATRPLATGRRSGQRVQHGQHGRRADARAEQHDRTFARAEDEAPARRAGVEDVAHAHAALRYVPAAAWGSIFTLTR